MPDFTTEGTERTERKHWGDTEFGEGAGCACAFIGLAVMILALGWFFQR